jgi:hypothetical protein
MKKLVLQITIQETERWRISEIPGAEGREKPGDAVRPPVPALEVETGKSCPAQVYRRKAIRKSIFRLFAHFPALLKRNKNGRSGLDRKEIKK